MSDTPSPAASEPDDAGAHEVPDDLVELYEAIEADRAGLLPEPGE